MSIQACEALATKAELEELRSQINTLLGKKEDGGTTDVLQAGTLAGTALLAGTILDFNELQDLRITGLSLIQDFHSLEIDNLEKDLQQEKELNDALSTSLSARITILESRETKKAQGGGAPIGVSESVATSQNKTLELIKVLTGADALNLPDITSQDIITNNSSFAPTFDEMIGDVPNVTSLNTKTLELENTVNNIQQGIDGQVKSEDFDLWGAQLKGDLSNKWQTLLGVALGAAVLPKLDLVANQTTPTAIGSAVGSEICSQTANPNSCLNTGIKKPITDQIKANKDAMLQALSTGILYQQGLQILNIVKKGFASTLVDKVLNTVNTALLVHNAVMLSNNIGQTIFDIADIVLNVAGE
jgi:hypothetical protein